MSSVKETINEKNEHNQIRDQGGGDVAISKLNTGEAFCAAVIFRHGPQNDAPPKIAVNLNIPFLPAGIDGIAPVFLIKQRENFAQEIVEIFDLLVPISEMSQLNAKFVLPRVLFMLRI